MKRLSRKIKRWFAHRQWNIFVFCLPALLASLVLVLVMAMFLFIHRQRDELRQRYHNLARSSLVAGQFEAARVACLRGLSGENSDGDRPQWLFYLAVAMNGLGHQHEALDLLAAAAPLDHPGCAQAHILVAQSLLNSTNLTAETLRNAEHHLLNALALNPQSLEVNELLGRFYINTHNLDKARERLLKIYPSKPDTALLLAISYALENDASAATLWADRAIAAIRKKLIKSAPRTNPSDRLGLVHALMIKGKYAPLLDPLERAMLTSTNSAPQNSPPVWLDLVRDLMHAEKYAPALETLEQATRVSPSPVYPLAIADVCAVWTEKIPPGNNVERLRLIQKGLKNAPENLKLQLLLVQATHAADDSGLAAKKLLDESVAAATGQSAAWWHFLLWTDARMKGDLTTARRHLQTAYELAPQIPQIQNDFAMDLSTGNREDLERALKIIQPVVDKFPNNPGFRDTRGQILARLGRNEAAAEDLEFAAARMANAINTRKTLAKVYDALGKTQLAEQQRRLAETAGKP